MKDRADSVGIVGLGAMGGGVAARLRTQGFAVVGHDIDAGRAETAEAIGVRLAQDVSDVASQAARILCLVDTGQQVLEVAQAIAAGIGPDDVFVCLSTIDEPVVEAAAEIVARTGAAYLDAPVSGGPSAARDGTLVSILGGSEAAVARVLPVIAAISKQHFHVGGVGTGFAAKMVNNLAFHTLSVLVLEALTVGTKAGLDPEQMVDLMRNATGNSAALRMRGPRILARDFEGVPLDVAFRELVMETGLAARQGVPVPLARMAEEVHRMGLAQGLGEKDGAALIKVYEDWAGVTVAAREA